MTPPRFLFVELNTRCNLRCGHCRFWQRSDDDRSGWMSEARRDELIAEFAAMGGRTVVTCGGEPMLDLESWFGLAAVARSSGLRMFSVVNGSQIADLEIARRIVAEGPHEITVSIDGLEATHDRARGTPGSFAAATRALALLVEARREVPPWRDRPRVFGMTIVAERNYRELPELYALILDQLGADKLKLNVLQPTFGLGGAHDHTYARELARDPADLARVILECDRRWSLRISAEWLRQVVGYHQDAHAAGQLGRGWQVPGTREHICDTHDRNIMLDRLGGARLCFSTAFPGASLRDAGSLREFWAVTAEGWRDRMRGCNRPCGISHSVRRVPATSRPGPGDTSPAAPTDDPLRPSTSDEVNQT